MKKLAKALPYIIILCCVIFLACTVIRMKDAADALNAQITALETANATLTEEAAALEADLAAANTAIAAA